MAAAVKASKDAVSMAARHEGARQAGARLEEGAGEAGESSGSAGGAEIGAGGGVGKAGGGPDGGGVAYTVRDFAHSSPGAVGAGGSLNTGPLDAEASKEGSSLFEALAGHGNLKGNLKGGQSSNNDTSAGPRPKLNEKQAEV